MDKKQLDGIYGFMAKVYQGNWQHRFGDTPFMEKTNSQGKRESVLAHQWALMEFWFQLRRLCTELDKVVDSLTLYEIIMNHDLGEITKGDVSLTRQLAGEGANKQMDERDGVKELTDSLSNATASQMLEMFDTYEQKPDDIKSLEVLLARFLDYLEGHHFALVFGDDLSEHSELIGKIVKGRWTVYTQKLIDLLKEKGFDLAASEVRQVAEHHMNDIFKKGIKFGFDGFK